MSHYEIDYSKVEENAKRKQAMEDIIQYLGIDYFNALDAQYREDKEKHGMTLAQFRFALMFVGIQGYPVTVWYETL